jgi:hypothetical protein
VVLSRTTQRHDVRCLRFLALRSLEENILQVSDAFVPAAEHIISRTTVNRNFPAIGLRAYHPFWMQRFTARNKVLHLEWCQVRLKWDFGWNSICFKGQSRFCLGGHDGRRRAQRFQGERPNIEFVLEGRHQSLEELWCGT